MVVSGNYLAIKPSNKPETIHMKIIEVTIRGYKNLKRKAFENLDEITSTMKPEVITQSMNAYLGAHPFNSAFEAALVDAAEKAGHKMNTRKSEKGNDVVDETNAEFLKRVKFTVNQAQAQSIVDGLAWPPEARERKDRVDEYIKVARAKVDGIVANGGNLEAIVAKLSKKGFETQTDDKGQYGRDDVVAAFAQYLRDSDF